MMRWRGRQQQLEPQNKRGVLEELDDFFAVVAIVVVVAGVVVVYKTELE